MKRIRQFLFFVFCTTCVVLNTSCIDDKDEEERGGETVVEIAVGDHLPSFRVTMNDGSTLDNKMLLGKRSVLVFFHTGCPDCQKELPIVDTLFMNHRDEAEFRLACIAREQQSEEILSYWQSHDLHLPFSPQDDKAVFLLFAASRIPRIYISDTSGIVRYIHDDRDLPPLDLLEQELSKTAQ